jgi:hypothetical protein
LLLRLSAATAQVAGQGYQKINQDRIFAQWPQATPRRKDAQESKAGLGPGLKQKKSLVQ